MNGASKERTAGLLVSTSRTRPGLSTAAQELLRAGRSREQVATCDPDPLPLSAIPRPYFARPARHEGVASQRQRCIPSSGTAWGATCRGHPGEGRAHPPGQRLWHRPQRVERKSCENELGLKSWSCLAPGHLPPRACSVRLPTYAWGAECPGMHPPSRAL